VIVIDDTPALSQSANILINNEGAVLGFDSTIYNVFPRLLKYTDSRSLKMFLKNVDMLFDLSDPSSSDPFCRIVSNLQENRYFQHNGRKVITKIISLKMLESSRNIDKTKLDLEGAPDLAINSKKMMTLNPTMSGTSSVKSREIKISVNRMSLGDIHAINIFNLQLSMPMRKAPSTKDQLTTLAAPNGQTNQIRRQNSSDSLKTDRHNRNRGFQFKYNIIDDVYFLAENKGEIEDLEFDPTDVKNSPLAALEAEMANYVDNLIRMSDRGVSTRDITQKKIDYAEGIRLRKLTNNPNNLAEYDEYEDEELRDEEEDKENEKNKNISSIFVPDYNEANSDSTQQTRTRYTIQRMIKQKKNISYGLVVVALFILCLLSVGISIYIYRIYKNNLKKQESYDHYSHLAYSLQQNFINLNFGINSMYLLANGVVAPFAPNISALRDSSIEQFTHYTALIKEDYTKLMNNENQDYEVWLEVNQKLFEAKVTFDNKTVGYLRGIQDTLSVLIQASNLEESTSVISPSTPSQIKDVQIKTWQNLANTVLSSFYLTFTDTISQQLASLVLTKMSSFWLSPSGILIFTSGYFLLYFIFILFIELEYTKKLDKLIRLFYGFRAQDCKELIRRCEKLIDRIQSSQLNTDDELLTPAGDENAYRVGENNNGYSSVDSGDINLKKRKGKGSLVKIVSIRTCVVFFFIAGNFSFKYYTLTSNQQVADQHKEEYALGHDLEKMITATISARAWMERSLVYAETTKSISTLQNILVEMQDIWSDTQQVSYFSFLFTLSYIANK